MNAVTGCLLGLMSLIAPTSLVLAKTPAAKPTTYAAPFATHAPVIDGNSSDPAWDKAPWRSLSHLISGTAPSGPEDLSVRYKVVWTANRLYILAEMQDDILMDSHPNPLDHYWDDDALEIFIDEDGSGGDHLFNYNAFAYHVSLDNQAVDMGPFLSKADEKADKANIRTYPHHITSAWKRSALAPYAIQWEIELAVFPSHYQDSPPAGTPPTEAVKLQAGKRLGFMLSYCDSDSPNGREHFIGDVDISPVNGDKNRGYIDAGVFGVLELVNPR
jgi:hypothetical protein